jgi:hypothetical protein
MKINKFSLFREKTKQNKIESDVGVGVGVGVGVDAKVTKQMNGLAGATFKNVDDSKKLKLEGKIFKIKSS